MQFVMCAKAKKPAHSICDANGFILLHSISV